jgi:plasmid maintenance system antidote protein VapI
LEASSDEINSKTGEINLLKSKEKEANESIKELNKILGEKEKHANQLISNQKKIEG